MEEEHEIKVQLQPMKFKDFKKLAGANPSALDTLEILDRIVVGGIDDLSVTMMQSIMAAVRVEMDKLANPVDTTGKN